MGHFSVEIYAPPGSTLNRNQQRIRREVEFKPRTRRLGSDCEVIQCKTGDFCPTFDHARRDDSAIEGRVEIIGNRAFERLTGFQTHDLKVEREEIFIVGRFCQTSLGTARTLASDWRLPHCDQMLGKLT
jgi:hypothetical protein